MRSLLLIVALVLCGCDATQNFVKDDPNPSAVVIETSRVQIEQTEEIKIANEKIGGHLDSIDNRADWILWRLAMVPDADFTDDHREMEDAAEIIRVSVDESQKEQVRIEEALEDLESANARVSAAIGEIDQLEDLIVEYEKTDREVRQEALRNLRGFISLAFTIGFSMVVGGAFVAFRVNPRLGGTIVGVGVLALGLATASQYYLEEIALVGLVALVVGFILVVFMLGNTLVRGRNYEEAIREIVELIEEIKDYMSTSDLDEMRKKIFGAQGFANQFTNEITKKIIAEVKAKNNFEKLSRKKIQK